MLRCRRIFGWASVVGLVLGALLSAASAGARTPEYFTARPDVRRCSAPLCGGFFLDPVDRRSMRCSDGKRRKECYVAGIDFGAVGPQIALSSSPLGVLALVRGEFEDLEFEGAKLQTLVASELWEPVAGTGSGRIFARLLDSGIRCIKEPCRSTAVEGLNRRLRRLVHEVDLSGVDLDEHELQAARDQITSQEGLVASGHFRRRRGDDGVRRRVFVAADAYFPWVSSSGCSSDAACSDDRWCRASGDGLNECIPFVGPKDRCGGFVLPSFFERCEPDLQCVSSEPTGDVPGTCATCEYEGVPYQEGESFPAADGCNTCSCSESGRVDCTLERCSQPLTCHVSGCSGQVCADGSLGPVFTTCEWRSEYACLQHSSCGNFGPGGACAWEPTSDYQVCLGAVDSRI